ncbi:hypothetical protein HYALB_00002378 [Hymenoscyphus albidus]|uniref:Uncharacterized protein n=1 Tax=Hymenoscyphus albidus TaxID=595503 RepID=A0A9N9LJ23_9HELO|nr:hypothetical protein HYALB_00002378 [Hymenoscyphus albidus]
MDTDAAELMVEQILKIRHISILARLEGIPIAADGDLFINLYTTRYVGNSTFPSALNNKPIEGKILSTVKVRRQVLAENFDFFKSMLSRNQFGERSQGTIDIHCDYPLAAQLWFRLYHDGPLPEVFSETPVEEVWNVIHWGGYLQAQHNSDQIDLSKLWPWFDKVLERYDPEKMDIDTTRMFLFPCYAFDHAEGFAEITKRLAYEMASHIQEKNPSSYFHGHLDHHIIGALNAARGSLRGNLIRGLFDPVSSFLNANCECKEKSLFSYCEALRGTEI